MKNAKIEKVIGREILDSRGNPTVEAQVYLQDGTMGMGASPSGASTGEFEALELRDNGERYRKMGVTCAVKNVNTHIEEALKGKEVTDIYALDNAMICADGTSDKSNLGANAILSTSIACIKAAAKEKDIPLYQYLGGISAITLPVPMMNIINGGVHVAGTKDKGLDTQEFMIMPIGAPSFSEALRMCSEVYHVLGENLKKDGYSTAVGDEGGYAPEFSSDKEAITYILRAIHNAGYSAGTKSEDFALAMDAAASEWKKAGEEGYYFLPKSKQRYTTEELIAYWKELVSTYPILSIEDPLDENDWEGWKMMTEELGDDIQLVGDDLFVTNTKRLSKGIMEGCANSILIKLNQIGTVSETINAIRMAKQAGYTAIVSHRSGETEDTTIADLAVALNTGLIKTGAPCRSERVAKYNRLLRIEEELGTRGQYAGWDCFGKRKQ